MQAKDVSNADNGAAECTAQILLHRTALILPFRVE